MATSTQIVWTFIFELLFLHESLNLWSITGTALILGYMMIVGIIKVVESGKHADADVEEGIDEKGLLLEESHKNGYGAITKTEETTSVAVLQWQGSNSF